VSDRSAAAGQAYADALRRVVVPGASVLDLGGDFARSAVLACRLGAVQVYSVQPARALPTAQAVVQANGCARQVVCVEHLDEAPCAFDVVIDSDVDGLPLHGLGLLSHARAREALARGAVPVPRREQLSAAVVCAPDLHHRHAGAWDIGEHLDFSVARQLTLNTWSLGRVEPGSLLSARQPWATLDYTALPPGARAGAGTGASAGAGMGAVLGPRAGGSIDAGAVPGPGASTSASAVAGHLDWTITRAGIAHGIVVWAEATLAEGIVLSNVPTLGGAPYGDAFFPWLEPVQLAIGDEVAVHIRADALGTSNVWTWTSSVRRAGAPPVASKQSTFFSSLQPLG
jgi:hypothetical protein